MRSVAFTIPGQPLPKERPRVMRGWSYTPPRTVEYEKKAGLFAQKAMGSQKPFSKSLIIRLDFFRKNKMRVDYDNLAKAVCDACNGRVWDDDSQIVEALITKSVDKKNPRTWVEVCEVER